MLVAEADLNGDGVISIDEFCGMMKRRLTHMRECATQDELKQIFKVCTFVSRVHVSPLRVQFVIFDGVVWRDGGWAHTRARRCLTCWVCVAAYVGARLLMRAVGPCMPN